MGRYGNLNRNKKKRKRNLNLALIFFIAVMAIFGGIGVYRYYIAAKENAILKEKYIELQKQINEKERLIERIKNGVQIGR